MKYTPPQYDHPLGWQTTLEGYELADSTGTIGIWNEAGDIVAQVVRADGSRAHSYGGPVYTPPQFLNVCERCALDDVSYCCGGDPAARGPGMTAAEKLVATGMARRVGWLA